ncbi:MAG: hypothetical protein BWK76_10760 [Desulfobulbaceae bacterium A2]|nr:MAG: hypothetical protein BWK76_10760 [Desulfobulbaceae bacterium A2]
MGETDSGGSPTVGEPAHSPLSVGIPIDTGLVRHFVPAARIFYIGSAISVSSINPLTLTLRWLAGLRKCVVLRPIMRRRRPAGKGYGLRHLFQPLFLPAMRGQMT